jgi:hypothetical protein
MKFQIQIYNLCLNLSSFYLLIFTIQEKTKFSLYPMLKLVLILTYGCLLSFYIIDFNH